MHQHIRHSLYYRVCSALAATLLLSLAAFSAARAADEAAAPPPVVEGAENIVITGQRPGVLRQLMNDFILEIGDPVASARGYARWRDRLCVGVYNLPDSKVAQYIADKITITALDVGLK